MFFYFVLSSIYTIFASEIGPRLISLVLVMTKN